MPNKTIIDSYDRNSVVNFFKNYNPGSIRVYLGESTNLLQDSDLQKKAKNLALELFPLGYTSNLYEKISDESNNGSENREYLFCTKKNNRFSLTFLSLNIKSKITGKFRKVNLPLTKNEN